MNGVDLPWICTQNLESNDINSIKRRAKNLISDSGNTPCPRCGSERHYLDHTSTQESFVRCLDCNAIIDESVFMTEQVANNE